MTYKQCTLAVALSTGFLFPALTAQDASETTTPAPDAAIRKIMAGLAQRDATTLYDAAPASYIKDITGIVRKASSFVDAETYNSVIGAVKQLATVLETKQDFLLNYPMLGMMAGGEEGMKQIEETLPKVVSALKAVTSGQLGSHKTLASFDLKTFLGKTANSLLAVAKTETVGANGKKVDILKDSEIILVSHKGNRATLDLVKPNGDSTKKDFVLVEGKWVPADIASEWDGKMAEIKRNLSAPPQQAQMMNMMIQGQLGMVTELLGSLQKAETQQKFNMIVGQAMQPIMQKMMGGGAGPSAPAEAAPRPASQPTKK